MDLLTDGFPRPHRIVLATANPGKTTELMALLDGLVEVIPRPATVADVDETADTLDGNARLKAEAIVAATGETALADDTGLEVDALGGRPGVHSARYAGADGDAERNTDRLLTELSEAVGSSSEARSARFRTVLVLLAPDGSELVVEGIVEGHIATERRGDGGFGYDPVFVPDEGDGRTFAEMTGDEKSAISHRGRAIRLLTEVLGDTSDID